MADNKKTFLDKVHEYLFSDPEVKETQLSRPQQDIVMRYRAIFTKWIEDWHFSDNDIANFIAKQFDISKSQAFHDVRHVKILMGNVQTAQKEFQRYRATEMIMKAYNILLEAESKLEIMKAESMIKAAIALGKIHKLGLKEDEPLPFDEIVPASFEVTGDVSVLGLKPIENLKELQQKLREKYRDFERQKVSDVAFEDVKDV
jgi:hypothetical protein